MLLVQCLELILKVYVTLKIKKKTKSIKLRNSFKDFESILSLNFKMKLY